MPARLERYLIQDFPFIHLVIGGVGNTTFLVGSVFFLFPSLERVALWLFVIGSFGMLVGTIGEAFVRHERKSRQRAVAPRRDMVS
ncbi:YrhK family protein [Streptomyces sp. MS06]|uniref:YrhK family protein n=1 Tax=Streptomyces sp. MS06 TaxID=3385974 RepID=UPI00399EECF0